MICMVSIFNPHYHNFIIYVFDTCYTLGFASLMWKFLGSSAEKHNTTGIASVTLVGLEKATNYSFQAAAFTKVGEGPKSQAIYCKTHDDGIIFVLCMLI